MSDGALAGLRRFLRELVQEGRTQTFIETGRVIRDYQLDSEVDAFLLVVRSGSPKLKPVAQLELGRIATPVDTGTAMHYFLDAFESGHPRAMPRAAFNMGVLLEDIDEQRATQCYLRAVETGDPAVLTKAALRAGELVSEQEPDLVEWAYREALKAPEADQEATLAMRLGVLIEGDDRDEALSLYRRAVRTGDAETAAHCALRAGLLLDDQQATPEFERACASEDADVAGLAALQLGVIHERRGNAGEAECWFRHAIASGSERIAPEASIHLGVLLEPRDVGGAEAAFAAAVESDSPEVAPRAAYRLMDLLNDQDRFAEGRGVYERARPLANESVSGPLDMQRALLAAFAGKRDEAARYLAAAVQAGGNELAEAVMGEGIRRQERGDGELAVAAYQLAETAGGKLGLRATARRAGSLRDLGRRTEAIVAFRTVIDADHGEVSDRASFLLAELIDDDDPAAARALYERAAASTDAEVADAASLRLLVR